MFVIFSASSLNTRKQKTEEKTKETRTYCNKNNRLTVTCHRRVDFETNRPKRMKKKRQKRSKYSRKLKNKDEVLNSRRTRGNLTSFGTQQISKLFCESNKNLI